ncbi:MAG: ComEC/Rec2 family competence protein, partial [Clostridia bacterium]|nr:ComEC/Rec2 family competence protein [Clostridia bacterium]
MDFVNGIYNSNELTIHGTIVDKEQLQGKIKYSAQITKCSDSHEYTNYKIVFYDNRKLDVGDSFVAYGSFSDPDKIHNYKGFSYKELLLSKGVLGTFNALEINRYQNKKSTEILLMNSIRSYICNILDQMLPQSNAELCKSIILGDKSGLDDDIIESFSNSSLSHVLAISGMHVMYISSIIMLCTFLLKKNISYVINIIGIIFFCRLVGNGESVCRATIMISLFLISKMLHRNSDSITNLSVAIIAVIIKNPFCIYSVGFQLSFVGTLGIIVLYKKINIKSCKNKFILYVQSQIALSFSANIFLLPIIAVKYNKVSINFFISSVIASILLTIIMPLVCICLLLNNHVNLISVFFSKLLYIASSGLIKASQVIASVKWMNYLVMTPSTIEIVVYFFAVLIFCGIMYGSQKDRKILQKLCFKLISVWLVCCLIMYGFNKFKSGMDIFFI